jgi:hypothetical protein
MARANRGNQARLALAYSKHRFELALAMHFGLVGMALQAFGSTTSHFPVPKRVAS